MRSIPAYCYRLKEVYIDFVDPQSEILILAIKTALAATISLLFFGYIWGENAAVWGSAASYFVVQTDLSTSPFGRIRFLFVVVLIFALLAMYGCWVGQWSKWGFCISMFILAFYTGRLNSISNKVWNAGNWGLVTFLLAGSAGTRTFNVIDLGLVFFTGGMIAVVICAISSQLSAQKQFALDSQRVIHKLGNMLKDIAKQGQDYRLYEKQVLLALQIQQESATQFKKNLNPQSPLIKDTDYLLTQCYKLFIFTKSLQATCHSLPNLYPQYSHLLRRIILTLGKMLDSVSKQFIHMQHQSHIDLENVLNQDQHKFEMLRATVVHSEQHHVPVLIHYSDCFYKIKQLSQLILALASGVRVFLSDTTTSESVNDEH